MFSPPDLFRRVTGFVEAIIMLDIFEVLHLGKILTFYTNVGMTDYRLGFGLDMEVDQLPCKSGLNLFERWYQRW